MFWNIIVHVICIQYFYYMDIKYVGRIYQTKVNHMQD